MLLSVKDIELLKLICWCKNIPVLAGTSFNSLYSSTELSILKSIGLLSKSRDGRNVRPRQAAYRLLDDAGYRIKPELKPQTGDTVIRRRNIASQILFTFYMAGVSVFNDKLSGNIKEPVYVASFAARQHAPNNPFGSTRFYGIFCVTQEAFLVFYADDAGVHFQNELTLFHSLTEIIGIRNTAIIIMGKSSVSIGKCILGVNKGDKEKKKNTDSFAKIFETTALPIHFIPLGSAGAQMLKLLMMPKYREATAKAILKGKYRPPYSGLTDTDTIHHLEPHYPAVVAADMDVNRIDRAILNAQSKGFERIAIYALYEQIPLLKSRYGNTGSAIIMQIDVDNIKGALEHDIELYRPPSSLYVTEEGRSFDVSDISSYRKA